MPLSFNQAKLQVNPDPSFRITPGSKEHKNILELMRQSGHVFAEDNVPEAPKPVLPRPKKIEDLNPHRGRLVPALEHKSLSKQRWLSVESNKKMYDEHIKKNQQVPVGYYEPEPSHLSWPEKTPALRAEGQRTEGISKRQWVASLINKI